MHLSRSFSVLSFLAAATSAVVPGPDAVPSQSPSTTVSLPIPTSWPLDTGPSPVTSASYWLEDIEHQGISAFNPTPETYQVFRNVKSFGAKGDGVTDDTAAINEAISSGGRCAPGSCRSSTTTPAIVYFPAGTYLISSSLIDYYYTQIIGNPNSLPTLKATPDFNGFGLIDGDPYGANGLGFGPTDIFYRQIRNLVLDTTAIPPGTVAYGIHWPTSQATSIQNCVFVLSDAPGTQHQGLFIESGSGGFMNDLVFYGGSNGAFFGNQQFTARNLTFYNAITAIQQSWNWGWTYTGINVVNCTTGLNMATGGSAHQTVGSVTMLDSSFIDTEVAIATAHTPSSSPATGGSLILDNISLTNVPIAVQGPSGTLLPGGSTKIVGWGQGHQYIPNGPTELSGPITPLARPASLTVDGKFYARSKPQYDNLPLSSFVSVRTAGAKGDGVTDDTAVLNRLLKTAAANGKVVFFDSGTYKVTSTVHIPPGSKIVGEAYPVIMGSGPFFSSIITPEAVVSVGNKGQSGIVEWSDMIVSTQGATAGAILIEWNLASPSSSPSGMWDVHTRIGGFAGSKLQAAECYTTPASGSLVEGKCIAAFMSIHFTHSSSGVYLENTWFWVADHDIDDPNLTRITIYAGRGLHSTSRAGTIWLVGTGVEHHTLYQYQFANTKDVFAGQIQTETAYYQPNPPATIPFPTLFTWKDPDFLLGCLGVPGNCAMGWGLRVVDSTSILVYGAGLYSFFDNYDTSCSAAGNGAVCQARIFSVEGASDVGIYNLNTIGSTSMVTKGGVSVAAHAENVNVFPDTVAYFRST